MRRRYVALGIAGIAVPVAAGSYLVQQRLVGNDPRVNAAHRFEVDFDAAAKALVSAPSVADAIVRADTRALESALVPVQVAHKVPLVDVVGVDGKILFAVRSDRYRDRAKTMVDTNTGAWPITSRILSSPTPPGPSPATVVKTAWGEAIYRAMPVLQGGHVVGAVLIGTPLEDVLKR